MSSFPSLPSAASIRRLLSESLTRFPPRCAPPSHRLSARARIGSAGLGQELDILSSRLSSSQVHLSSFAGPLACAPRIGIAMSGGGYRALVGGLGSLRALIRLGLLDSSLYFSSLSGSSWLVSLVLQHLTKQPNQAINVNHLNQTIKERLSDSLFSSSISSEFVQSSVTDKLAHLLTLTNNSFSSSSFSLSLIDLFSWALNEHLLRDKNNSKDNQTICLSDQLTSLSGGQFPFPLYTAINDKSMQWEFSPCEIGSSELNYWIPTWTLGKQWEAGVAKASDIPEPPLALLLAVFGSAHCVSADRILEELSYVSPTIAQLIESIRSRAFHPLSLGTTRPFAPHPFPNPLYHYDSSPISKEKNIHLFDAGTAFNIPFTPLLQPSRELDIIFVFDYSSPPESFTGVWMKLAADYAKFHSLPFPDLNRSVQLGHQIQSKNASTISPATSSSPPIPYAVTSEQSSLQRAMVNSLSVFPGSLSDGLPTIVYLPLLRNPAYDIEFDPRENFLQGGFCSTLNFKYTSEQIDQLSGLTEFTLLEARPILKEIIRTVAEEKEKLLNKRKSKEYR
jgi:phospholipase A2